MPDPDSMILLDCDGVAVVILRGEFDLVTADHLQSFLTAQVRADRPVVVDLTDVEFADSSTFRVFLRIDNQLRTSDRRLVIQVNDESPVYRTMTIMGLDAHFRCAPSRDAALTLAREPAGVQR